ncbi:dual oxidase maturation factor 2 [Carettochelys insculpta]|uniref:dual oxidase maturation factor 2 n=1 Tax=Carettochelys insculpta TaxID=44489 RepID=UPI003EB6D6F0
MTLFDGVYNFYPQARKAFAFDVPSLIVIVVFLSLALSFLLILPGIRGRARLYWLLRVLLSLFIGAVIVAVQFTGDWETGWVTVNAPYKSFSSAVVNADVGLHIGLGGVNVTLVGNPVNQLNETISYNEHFPWYFGENYDQTYTNSLAKGLPSPILYVAEKFTQQSPCGVYSQYRISGHYASATMWVAFCAWLISNMLFSMPVLVYGGYMSLITGTFMIFSLLSFSTVRNSPMCAIQFGPASLQTVYGASFWLTLATSLLCFLIGVAVTVLHFFRPKALKAFFDLSEDKAEGDALLGEAYANPHFQPSLKRPYDNFAMTLKAV